MGILSKYGEQYRATIALALPVVMTQVGQILVQFADNVMVGRYGGEDALPLAAVSFGSGVFFLFFIAAIGITFGLTPVIGELYAQKRLKRSAELFQSGIQLYFIVGLATSLLLHLFTPALYELGQPKEVVDMAIPYYRYLMLSMPFIMLFFSSKQFLEGVGNTKVQMVMTIICNSLNILLNWIFIYGKFGFQDMGAEGAGLATFISRAILPFAMFGYMLQNRKYKIYFSEFNLIRLRFGDHKRLLKIGIPISTQVFLESSAFVITAIMMGWFNTVAISANQIVTTMTNTTFSILLSVGIAVTIRISHNYGLRNIEQIKLSTISSYHIAIAWSIISAAGLYLLRYPIARLFTSNAEVIELTAQMMPFVALFQISDCLQNVSVGILRGLQEVKIIMPIAFISYILLNLPIGYLLGFTLGMGPSGLILGYLVGLSSAAIFMIIHIRKKIRGLEQEFSSNSN